MQHSALPYELRHFDIYKKALRYNEESDANSKKATKRLVSDSVITPQFITFAKAAEEANTKAIQQLANYGAKFLDTYIEPTIQETDDSLNMLMGLTAQYQYRDTCHTKEWDWQLFKRIKSNIATLSIGIKANSGLRDQTFDELHKLIKLMWSNHSELLELSYRLSDMIACFEDWQSKRGNTP